jgi:hypothetical protein
MQQKPTAEETKPKPPPVPFRIDATGLSTSHLPPPPKRKDGADGRTLPPPGPKPKPPGLPPRLLPRETSSPVSGPAPSSAATEPDAHKGILNQNSLNRLGAAGVSVPGLDIGTSSPASTAPKNPTAPSTAQLNELQSRFSRLSSNPPGPRSPSHSTSPAPKQTAFQTHSPSREHLPPPSSNQARNEHASSLGKKKPPPPPAKKASLMSPGSFQEAAPPPLPLSSKPKPQVSSLFCLLLMDTCDDFPALCSFTTLDTVSVW